MQRYKRWWSRAVIGSVLVTLAGVMPAVADTASTTPSKDPAPNAAPSSRPAAGPEKAFASGSRPVSGKYPSAGVAPFKKDRLGTWLVSSPVVRLSNTVTDADGDQADLTFEVWTADSSGQPGTKVKIADNEYGLRLPHLGLRRKAVRDQLVAVGPFPHRTARRSHPSRARLQGTATELVRRPALLEADEAAGLPHPRSHAQNEQERTAVRASRR